MGEHLQTYRLYEAPDTFWDDTYFLVLEYDDDVIKGILFNKETMEMNCMFMVKRSWEELLKSVDYIYDEDSKFILKLINRGTNDS